MRRPRKLGSRTRHHSPVTECGVLRRKFWQVSRLIRSSHIIIIIIIIIIIAVVIIIIIIIIIVIIII